MNKDLLDFIRHARERGMDHATIRVMLLSAGWREKDVAKGLAEEGLDIPVPEPPAVGGAKEAFQYLLTFTALTFVVVNAIVIGFRFIDWLLPDPSKTYESYEIGYHQAAIRWAMAMLMVAFPLYVASTWWIGSDLRKNPGRSKSPIRRWLTYLALFAAAVTMTGDIICLVYGVLEGDLTKRFVLQVCVVLIASALVFCYYLFSLRIPESNLGPALGRLNWGFGGVSVVLFGLAIVVGFILVESPFRARLRRLDDRRIADFQQIEVAIRRQVVDFDQDRKAHLKRSLPADLDAVAAFVTEDEHRAKLNLLDPQSGKKYGYTVKGESSFELCAEFSLDDRNRQDSWTHPAGQYCFIIDILKDSRPSYR